MAPLHVNGHSDCVFLSRVSSISCDPSRSGRDAVVYTKNAGLSAAVMTPLSTPRMRDSQLQPLAAGGEGESNGLQEGNKLTVGAAAQEKSTEEEMAEMEKSGADSAVGATTSVLVTRT